MKTIESFCLLKERDVSVVGGRSRRHRDPGGFPFEEHARNAGQLPHQGNVPGHSLPGTRGATRLV